MTTEHLEACALALNFFGRIFLDCPEHDLLVRLKNDALLNDWPLPVRTEGGTRGLELLTTYVNGYTEAARPSLEAEHTSLYIGPANAIPLWESAWTTKDKLLFDGPMFEVREAYARYGLASPNSEHEPDDHIGLELSFLGGILSLVSQALDEGDAEAAKEHGIAARNFMQAHLSGWAFAFMKITAEHSDANFYRAAALLCEDALGSTREMLAAFPI